MLTGLNGKPVKIKKTGAIYPVDVELSSETGENVLLISSKINFIDSFMADSEAPAEWKTAVLDGMRDWSGEYRVFGNQPLNVVVQVEESDKIMDTVFVFCIDEQAGKDLRDTYGKLNLKKAEQLMAEDRSFASAGFPAFGWKAYLPRFVYMLNSTLEDFEYARRVAKHEFGHILGLGDLYKDLSLGLSGVDGLLFEDIKPYYKGDGFFDMVMCNSGPVTNNDIEMVLLAFQTNRFQNYQKCKEKDKVSAAVGKGN